jgi:NAD(P)-dependent dehydrogenase (short-subunit alcohol dehydrogenase family)
MATSKNVSVVTGASRGIGQAIARALAQRGDEVWALSRTPSNTDGLRSLVVDVCDERQIATACDTILKESGAPNVLVNNAGIALSAPLSKTSAEDFDRVMSINCRAAFLFCRWLMPEMAKAGRGQVINIASTAALKGYKYTSAYTASKHALLGLTRSLAIEYAPKGITVNAVCPGWTDTDMLQRAAEAIWRATGRSQEESVKVLSEMNPMHRLIKPDEVAQCCLFLASPAGAAVTGAAYTIDGGESA